MNLWLSYVFFIYKRENVKYRSVELIIFVFDVYNCEIIGWLFLILIDCNEYEVGWDKRR